AKKAAKKIATKKKRAESVGKAVEATEDELPWILRDPPWQNPKAIPPLPFLEVVVPSVDTIAFEERLHLNEDDRAGIAPGDQVDDDDWVGMLASHGLSVLPKLLAVPATASVNGLRHVESPRVTPKMLELLVTPRRAVAIAWFRNYPMAC